MKVDIDKIKDMKNIFMIAPAGCGKTETIADIIGSKEQAKKYLILTHTNAGVECISKRLRKKKISSKQYQIHTIASFCYKYVNAYPRLSKMENINKSDYNETYKGMTILLKNKNIQRVLVNTYNQVLIDEYQDCTKLQHDLIVTLSKIIPCKLFGDPLQGIFEFRDKLVKWDEVKNDFADAGTFEYPWRWEKHNKQLGNWIMQVRRKLINNEDIYLSTLPFGVEWIYNDDNRVNLVKKANELLSNQEEKLILFQFPYQAHQFAQKMGGKYFSQEEVECKELRDIAVYIENNNTITSIYEMAKICFTQFNIQLGTIYKKIEDKEYNFNRISKNKEVAKATIESIQDNKYYRIIEEIEKIKAMKLYRRELWNEFKKLIREIQLHNEKNINEIIDNIRKNSTLNNKYKYRNLVSRILLVKGLEFNTVVLVNPEKLNKELFYVAISRPTDRLIIVSKNKKLNFCK